MRAACVPSIRIVADYVVAVRWQGFLANRESLAVRPGKFEFNGLAAGKYSLVGAKRGFVTSAYDQHDQFSTAIVTGAGLETEALIL